MDDTYPKNTAAWRFQVWASFALALGLTLAGIWHLPADLWTRGFLAMGLLFTTGSSFTLSKTIRDDLEAERHASRAARKSGFAYGDS